MHTITANEGIHGLSWRVNPFEELHRIWAELVELHSTGGRVHIAGRIEEATGSIVDIELSPVAFERDVRLIVRDGNEVFFVVPVNVMEGIEGAYLKILDVLEEA